MSLHQEPYPSKHTPGDWIVNGTAIESEDAFGISTVIASVYDEREIDVDTAEVRANARLIAAAPDLLEACKSLFAACSHPNYVFSEAELIVHREMLQSAISKAEGGVQ